MSDDGSQKCVQSVEFLVRAYSEWRSMCSSQRSAEVEKARSTVYSGDDHGAKQVDRWVDTYKDHAEFGYVFRENARDVLNKQNPGSVKATLEYLSKLA